MLLDELHAASGQSDVLAMGGNECTGGASSRSEIGNGAGRIIPSDGSADLNELGDDRFNGGRVAGDENTTRLPHQDGSVSRLALASAEDHHLTPKAEGHLGRLMSAPEAESVDRARHSAQPRPNGGPHPPGRTV